MVNAASRAWPKLTGLDKAVAVAFKDHTKYRLSTEAERARGAQKIVKDETRTNLSMYGAYAGAAGSLFEGLAATQDQSSRKGFETAKAFNMAAAVMNTASAIMNAMATVPWPMSVQPLLWPAPPAPFRSQRLHQPHSAAGPKPLQCQAPRLAAAEHPAAVPAWAT